MKNWLFLMAFVVLLSGCSHLKTNSIHGNAEIDWVDFVKLNGNSYIGLHEGVIKDRNDITDQVVGEVKFKVADAVTNPNYRTKSGDAAFLEVGTKFYQVKGFEPKELIATRDEKMIGGYRLYVEDKLDTKLHQNYKDLPKNKVKQISLFFANEVRPYKTLYDEDKERFIQILEKGRDTQSYEPQTTEDPTYYMMVFYTDESLAYAYTLADDGVNVYFFPWDTRIVDNEIRKLIQ